MQAYREQLPILGDLLGGVRLPVRVVQGENDQVVPAGNANYLADRIPTSRVDLIPGAGHFCWEEKPSAYAALVVDWWRRAS